MRACLGTMAGLPRGLLALLGALVISAGAATPNAHHGSPASKSVLVERAVYLMGTRATLVAHAGERTMGLRRLERMVRILETCRGRAQHLAGRQPPQCAQPPIAEHAVARPGVGVPAVRRAFHVVPREPTWPSIRLLARSLMFGACGGMGSGQRRTPFRWPQLAPGLRHVAFDPETCAVTRRVDVTIDAGGFGKGEGASARGPRPSARNPRKAG